jgi:hypothetical protein
VEKLIPLRISSRIFWKEALTGTPQVEQFYYILPHIPKAVIGIAFTGEILRP